MPLSGVASVLATLSRHVGEGVTLKRQHGVSHVQLAARDRSLERVYSTRCRLHYPGRVQRKA